MFTSIPGSGKSHFARQAAQRMCAVRLSSDALRPAMLGSMESWYQAVDKNGRPKMLEQLFGAMDYVSEQVLAAGADCIYDSNMNKRDHREKQAERARRHNAIPTIVSLEVPYEVALRRGQEREEQADQRRKSEAQMRELIERIQNGTDPFGSSELVVRLDGQKSFNEQFADFEAQAAELLNG